MSDITIHGIKNCDTMKKAFAWLDDHKIIYSFHDYTKSAVDENLLRTAIEQCGWNNVINRRGTTWRKLPYSVRNNMDAESAVKIALENSSIIKRPLLVHGNDIHLGFKDEIYQKIFP